MPVHGIDNGNNKHEVYTTEELLSILQQAINSGSLQGIDPTQTPIVAAVRESHNNSDITFWSGTEAEFNELTGVTSELIGARIGSDGKLYLLSGDTTLSDTIQACYDAALEATEGMKREVISVTLTAAGWSNTAPYTQTVAVPGMTDDKDFLAPYVVPTGNESDDLAAQVALSCISGGTTDTDSVTFYCYDEKPTTTITVYMVDKGTKLESSYPIASSTNIGMVKIGDGLEIDQAGELSVSVGETTSFVFDSVAEMQAYDLTAGVTVKTLGYRSANDGGGATYQIRAKTASDTADGSFIIAINETLIAELIIENGIIYANQLGADNTGAYDASVVINRALAKINAYWLNNIKINTLVFNGIYKIDNQIEIPPCAKLRSDGMVKFISSVVDDSTFFIHYLSSDLPTSDTAKTRYMSGDIMNFESGCVLEHTGDYLNSTATAIEIGDRSDLGSTYAVARYMIRNINIYNFNIGLLLNGFNVYIGNHENVIMEQNNINIQFGVSSQSGTNYGERLTFNNCLIGVARNGVLFETESWGTFFNNCSFDFDNTVFEQGTASLRWNKINVTGCHIEGFYTLAKNFASTATYINISNTEILNSTGSTNVLDNVACFVALTDANLQHKYSTDDYTPEHYLALNQSIRLNNTMSYNPGSAKLFILDNNLISNFVDDVADGSLDIAANNYIGEFKVLEKYNCASTGTVVTDDYLYTGHKSLILTKTGQNGVILVAQTDNIPLNGAKLITATLLMYGNKNKNSRCQIFFYDKDGNRIQNATQEGQSLHNTPATDEWIINPYGWSGIAPSNAYYFRAHLVFNGEASDEVDTQYKIGGVIVNAR